MDNIEKKKIYKVRKTCIEMLKDRKFEIPKIVEDLSFEDFKIMFDNKNIDISLDNNETKIYVFFQLEDSKFGKNELKKLVDKIFNSFGTTNVLSILVLKDKASAPIRKEINHPKYENVELFQRRNMLFNVTKHQLVPKHIPLTKEEAQKVMDIYDTKLDQFPGIFETDPQAKYYGMKVGDMCKIIRNNKFNGVSISYRVVIPSN